MPDEWRLLDVTWPLFLAYDPRERERLRKRQRMQLGRYGRQSVLQWDGVELCDFLDYYAELFSIIEEEAPAATPGEDR